MLENFQMFVLERLQNIKFNYDDVISTELSFEYHFETNLLGTAISISI